MKKRKIISLILCVMMVMCTMPSFVFATDTDAAEPQSAAEAGEQAADTEESAEEREAAEDKETAADDETAVSSEPQDENAKAEESGEAKASEEKAEEKPEEAGKEKTEEKKPAFEDSKTVDGVKVTVSAGEGIFPEGAKLAVNKVKASEEKKVGSAVDKVRDDDANVALSYVFDIHVEDKEGKEIQPADGKAVKLSFETEEVADSNLTADVYHVTDKGGTLKADDLDVKTDGDTASASTDGFSYYTVEFTYGDLQYSMKGDSEIALSAILENIGLAGTVTKAVSSNPELFSVEKKNGEWTIKANKAFQSEETLTVTVDDIDYVIKVTDDVTADPHDHTHKGWTAWNNNSSLPSTAGKYYLTKDVTLSGDCLFNSNVELCLNGHTITMTGNSKYIGPTSNKTLTIYDEPGNSGGIVFNNNRFAVSGVFNLYGGTFKGCTRSYEGALSVSSSGTFNMYGGVFSGNTSGSVLQTADNTSRLNIYGGEITDNTVTSAPVYASYGTTTISGGTISGNKGYDGAVYATGNGKTYISGGIIKDNIGRRAAVLVSGLTSLYLSGNVYISGNKLENGKECNVKLDSNNYRINISGELTNTTPIGITVYTPPTGDNTVEFTTGLSGKGTAANFSSDNPDCAVTIKNNEAHLVNHSHTFNYTAAGDTITAECVNTTTPCSLPDNETTLKIVKPARTVYGGSGSAEATFEGTIPGVTPTAEYYKGTDKLSAAPKDAGTYKAQVTLKGSDEKEATAFVEYTIDKADITPVVEIENWNYGETAKTPSVTEASNPGSGTVTYEYYTDEACTQKTTSAQGATEEGGVPSYGGDYWVKATVEETDNYKSGTGTKGFKINATAVKVTGLKFVSKEYDGNTTATLDKSEAELVGVDPSEDVHIASATGVFDNKNVGPGKTISNITIVLSGSKAGGYKATADPTTLTGAITAKPVKVSGITASDKIYDGNTDADLTFTGAAFAGIIDGDSLTVEGETTQKGTFDNKNVDTGKTVTLPELKLGGDSAGNYSIKDDSQTEAKANITAKAINVTAVDKSKTFDDKDPELTYTADALVTGDKFTGNLTRAEGENAGIYDINQGTLTAGDNYTISYTKGTFTINKAMTNSVTASIEGWTYGDDPKTPTAKAAHGQKTATFSYSSSKEGEYKAEVPATAGTWYVKATVAETDNYAGAVSEPEPFTIAKKEVGLDWTDTELTYNGEAQKPVATATGLVGEDECEVTVGGEQTDANARTGTESYEAEAIALDNPNYKLPEDVKKNFTIAPKELKQSMISLDSDTIKHDGTKKGPEVTMTDKDITEGEQPKQMAKDEDYTLSGDVSSSELGTHVITAEGKGNYTGSIETSWMMYSKKSNEQKEEGIGDRGDFEVFVDIENNSSTLTVDNLTIDLAKGFLTEEDMARYMEGEAVLVYMIVKEQPKSETGAGDRYILGQLFREENASDITWYDITVWKKIGNSPAVQVHDTVEELSMSVEVPDGLKNAPEGYTREFYLGRSHDGASKLLAHTSKVKVGFGSSKFSTYALAYKDTEKPVDPDDPDNGGSGSGNGGSGSSKGGSKTGDPNDIAGLLALILAAGGALGAMGCRRRRSGRSR